VIRVQVHRHGGSFWEGAPPELFAQWAPGRQGVELPDGAAVADLLELLAVDSGLVSLVVVNGRVSSVTGELADGDSVDLIPPITGGGAGS
jgi:molybdopterin converting factor small subunit